MDPLLTVGRVVGRELARTFVAVVFAVAIFGQLSSSAWAAAPAAPTGELSPSAIDQIVAILAAKATRNPDQQKMDSQLLQAVLEARGQQLVSGVALAPVEMIRINGDFVAVDINVTTSAAVYALVAKLEDLGGTIIHASAPYKTVRAQIHLADAETVAAFPEVTFIQPAVQALTSRVSTPVVLRTGGSSPAKRLPITVRAALLRENLPAIVAAATLRAVPLSGSVNSQGDRAHRADDVRSTFGSMGAGIRIGVLSDSYDATGAAGADITSGNLPGAGNPAGHTAAVTVLQDFSGGGDEGRAMLQIVHDLAPEARLYFATAFVSEASFASNITALRNSPNNCDIIIDDIFYYDEPPFQDGIVAQAVSTVTAGGGLYFSSAGNEGSVAKGSAGYFEGDFNSAGSPAFTFPGGTKAGTIHNFGTVGSPVNGDVILSKGKTYTLAWSDPQNASTNDYDLFLVSSGGTVKAQSTNNQTGSQSPFESISPPTLASGDRLIVFKANAAAVRAFSLNTFRGTLSVTTTGQTHGHSAVADAFSVAAASAEAVYPSAFSGTSQAETFTSDGPRRIFYQPNGTAITPGNLLIGTNGGTVRNKPDITGADGVSTTLPSGGLNPFYGTSAAAPHAGAIAALLKSADPTLTPAQIRTILTTTAVDVESAGYDNITGIGIVQAFQAMQAVAPSSGNCGTQGVSSIVKPADEATTSLPPGGTWQHERREGGETWTYSFEIVETPSGNKSAHPERAAATPVAGTATSARVLESGPVSAPNSGETNTAERDGASTAQPPFFGDPLRQWFVDDDAMARLAWSTVAADVAGESAANGTTVLASTGALMVSRLVAPVELAGGGLTAFEAGFQAVAPDRELESVRVFLELTHPHIDQLTVALGDETHLLVLWNGRDGGTPHDSGLTIDRVISKELMAAPLPTSSKLYILDRGRSARAVLQQAWIATAANPRGPAPTRGTVGALATLDIGAIRSYLRTAPGGGGSEVDPPTVGQTVYLHGDFQVTGSGSAVTVTQRALLDGSTFCSGSASASPGFTYVVSCNSGWSATAGAHTLRWDFDYGNTVAETNEGNNSASKNFTSGGLDIGAIRSYLRTASSGGGSEVDPPTVGQTVYFHGDFQVTGSGSAVTVTQRALLDGSVFCSGSSSASPGPSYIVSCNSGWSATAGSHTLRWDYDYGNTVSETNESNNSASKSFTSGGLDIGAIRSYLRTAPGGGGSEVDPPTAGQTVYFHGDLQVTGSGSAVTITQRALLDGSVFCNGSSSGSPGFSYIVSCNNGWPATVGSHTLRWDYDYNNSVAETNENNNSASKSFTSAASLDIAATRAYLRTAPGGGGTEVDPPAAAQTVYFHGDFQVTGSGGAVAVTQRALLDGSVFCSGSASASPGLAYIVSCNNGWAATAGAHTLQWDFDYGNDIPETNEGNNSTTKGFTTAGGSIDIVAQRAYLRTAASGGGSEVSSPNVGQPIYFHADYQLTGSGSAVAVTERALLDGSAFCSCSNNVVPGGSYLAWCNQAWTATSGSHTLQWDFDYNNSVVETNEGNNSTSGAFSAATLTAPTNVLATALSASQVQVNWTAVAGAASYQIFRTSNNSGYALAGTSATNSFTNNNLAANTAYLYQVRAVDSSSGIGPASNVDLATTVMFNDDPLGTTAVKAVHLTQLRIAVNAVRASSGLPAASFTGAITAGVLIRSVHINELRARLDEARSAAGLPTLAYTNAISAGVSTVKSVDVVEIRNGVR
jgi:hypothetical protein